jgi:hypothetical protein
LLLIRITLILSADDASEGGSVEDLTRRDLIKQLRVLRERQSALIGRRSDEDTFPAWVLLATATRNAREAAESECGGSDDGMNDAIFIDPNAPLIWIVQGKFRKTVMGTPIHRSPLTGRGCVGTRRRMSCSRRPPRSFGRSPTRPASCLLPCGSSTRPSRATQPR